MCAICHKATILLYFAAVKISCFTVYRVYIPQQITKPQNMKKFLRKIVVTKPLPVTAIAAISPPMWKVVSLILTMLHQFPKITFYSKQERMTNTGWSCHLRALM